jgi:signal transduction histidine kinase
MIWMVVGFSWILFERYQNLQKSVAQVSLDIEIERNQLIARQNEQLEERVSQRTAELVATQQQLIQSEKLASLGELTAGIAHEIQNPLNFVNNFSEVSIELAAEMKEELNNDNKEDAFALADDISDNLQKIIHHGRRADAIVKNMLQHSRNNSAEKEATDLNKLADEYLRLSYHGLRAKDKSFNSELKTVLDPNLPLVTLIPQDIGRVLINLYNNAFYAVQQKQKTQEHTAYKPEVSLTTLALEDTVQITVRDNGNGIPDSIKDKILQPFFTTKPTGEGTGLGLSLSYDIIKVHGGELQINSTAGEGSAFRITLPVA